MERSSTPLGSKQIFFLIASIRRKLQRSSLHSPSSGVVLFLSALRLGTSSLLTPFINRRGTAELFELSRQARFVQSFQAYPFRSVPNVLPKRLGPSADPDRWARHGRGLWWLIWLDDGDPLLAFPSASNSSSLDLLFADAYIAAVLINSNRFSEGSLRPWSRAACRG